jgi:serine/threonine-protein kinase HipA
VRYRIDRYCINPISDLEQLLGQLLINQALHNTDDHLRNFSFLHDGKGWQLSPAYDIVPDETMGAYHQLTLEGKPFLPSLDEAETTGKALGLGKAASRRVGQQVTHALAQWPDILAQANIEKSEYKRLVALIN